VGKSRRGSKEFSREQELKHENQKLKRENGRLRKELARFDLDRFNQIKEAIEESYQDERAQEGREIIEKLKKEWACKEPNCTGFLEIFTYNRAGETWYYRICSNSPGCKNRTKAQKYCSDVKGPIRENGESKV
jgi:hypothetical protein